jgi:hypothetical protein
LNVLDMKSRDWRQSFFYLVMGECPIHNKVAFHQHSREVMAATMVFLKGIYRQRFASPDHEVVSSDDEDLAVPSGYLSGGDDHSVVALPPCSLFDCANHS